MLCLFLIRVDLILLLNLQLIGGNSVLHIPWVQLIDHSVDVFVVGEDYFGEENPMVDVIDIEVLGLSSTEQIISTWGVSNRLDVFGTCVVVRWDLAEVTSSSCHFRVKDSLESTAFWFPDEDFSFHSGDGHLVLGRMHCHCCDLRPML